MSDAADFVDYTLQGEASWSRAEEAKAKVGSTMQFYGASVGAVRGTVRDTLRRYPDLRHDEIVVVSSELWAVPVFERRLAAIVLLQSRVHELTNTDLTRIEGFLRQAEVPDLADPLAKDVVGPLLARLEGQQKRRADRVVDRWSTDPAPMLRRAAVTARAREILPAQQP